MPTNNNWMFLYYILIKQLPCYFKHLYQWWAVNKKKSLAVMISNFWTIISRSFIKQSNFHFDLKNASFVVLFIFSIASNSKNKRIFACVLCRAMPCHAKKSHKLTVTSYCEWNERKLAWKLNQFPVPLSKIRASSIRWWGWWNLISNVFKSQTIFGCE